MHTLWRSNNPSKGAWIVDSSRNSTGCVPLCTFTQANLSLSSILFPGLNDTSQIHEDGTASWNTDIQETTMSQYHFWQWIIANPLEVQQKLGLVGGDIFCWHELVIRGVPFDIAACGCLLVCHPWRELTPYEHEVMLQYRRENVKIVSSDRIAARWYQILIFSIIFLTGTTGRHITFAFLSIYYVKFLSEADLVPLWF